MELKKGKFIVIYGINNLGKTTQAKMLVEKLNNYGYRAEYIKYPIYELEPAGKLINEYYRFNNPRHLTARESQLLHYLDRKNYEPILKNKLEKGINIIAEDYFGTALAWGLAAGVDLELLKYLYSFVYPEDLAFIFDGERFTDSIEKNHLHETNEFLINTARSAHLKIGAEYGWLKINANLSIEEIHKILWAEVMNLINKPISYFIAPNFKKLHDRICQQPSQNNSANFFQPIYKTDKILVQRLSLLSRQPIKNNNGGYDLFAADYCLIPPRSRAEVKTGLKIIPPAGHSVFVVNHKNAKGKKIYILMNIINPDYEIIVDIINFDNKNYNISPGDKIAQLVVQKTEMIDIENL